jgi:hypothetical protein
MASSQSKTSAEIQQEINQERERIGDRIDAIQDRMSPGQIIDEALSYAKRSGSTEYVRNLGRAMKTNPVPVALMGVSMAWLMARQGDADRPSEPAMPHVDDYPLYPTVGPVRRIGPPEGEGEGRFSHFTDDTGKRLKALTDEAGHRAGHFVDEAGRTYRGFKDASGRQIDRVLDETGAAIDAASGWSSATWSKIKHAGSEIGDRASAAAHSVGDAAASAGSQVRDHTAELNDAILRHFRDQPLVGGALAFAVGAAIGAALPETETEDAAIGKASDKAKKAAVRKASDMAEAGQEKAAETMERAADVATDVYETARERVSSELGNAKNGNSSSEGSP